jgi:hypothetical protein
MRSKSSSAAANASNLSAKVPGTEEFRREAAEGRSDDSAADPIAAACSAASG